MDPDWDEVSRTPLPPPGVRAHPTPVTTLAFDTSQELLWAGNEYGRVCSFYSTELQQYTSFKAHSSQDGRVHQLLFNDKGVIALGSRSVHMAMRRGPPLWTVRHDDMKELRCMTFTSKGTAEILVAGEQDKMFVIDVNKGEVVKIVPTEHHYKIMRRSRHICAATTGTSVHILDSLSFKVVKIWSPHSGTVHDMDAQHDFIVTCGITPRQQGYSMFDPYVNVFDLKNMVSMNPVPFPAGGAYVRMHPRMSTTSIVISQSGQMHVVDLLNPNTTNVKQANTLFLSSVDIAPSGEAMALADGDCNILLWGSPSKIQFVELPTMVETADQELPAPHLDWDDSTPLSSVGMPYYRETLLSAWPQDAVYEVGAPPSKEDPHFLSTLQRRDWGWYGKNTRGLRRNQVEDTRRLDKDKEQGLLNKPKFLSEQARDIAHSASGTPAPEELAPEPTQAVTSRALESHKVSVPELYQSIDIQFSKFGIDDFDFGFYNKSQYAGLQNHIANCYANALLQVMYFTPALRNVALHHAATGCFDELCLLCELGFLFDMLSKADGAPCHASNLLKIISYHPQAAQKGLLEDLPHPGTRSKMLQDFLRFILEKIVVDYNRMGRATPLEKVCFVHESKVLLFETTATTSIRCTNCGSETTRPGSSYVHNLMYPPNKTAQRHAKAPKVTFSQILKKSVESDTTTKGWCQTCHKYQTLGTKKVIYGIPTVLSLAANVQTDEHRRMWATAGWLPEEIGIIVNNGQFFCYEGEDLRYQLQRGYHEMAVYSLTGLVVSIDTGSSKDGHLVAMANVAHSAPEPPGKSQWYLLNDFHVKPVSPEEALTFNATWKTPSVITYQLKSANNKIDNSWKDKLDSSLLYFDLKPALPDKTYRILDETTEKVVQGAIIAIDTEFVSISNAEIEITSDGDERTIRPTVHALARTSVLRGSGEDEGVPFVDDYVHIRETVIDYLTAYSGIVPEDLDPTRTKHNLVPLKIVYKKLWILLNLGCKFLGHGLKQDFRVINIHVPRAQIIDTSDLFFQPAKKRKLSLQFLAWVLLKEDIQLETHDSIEDARTALRLYRKYQEFTDAGIFEAMLQDVYQRGFALNFKPPSKQLGSSTNIGTPSITRTVTPPIDSAVGGPSTPGQKTSAAISGPGVFNSSPGWATPNRTLNLR
ncbi:PAB-dependent poly(A)-specific ribonuclease subunit PAN2 [Xylariales sp. PMI_506]|nr:PAB-dependent poly(A)-specific ribonuclease subunit PAN2 [Xylariales sp. PMI_506]